MVASALRCSAAVNRRATSPSPRSTIRRIAPPHARRTTLSFLTGRTACRESAGWPLGLNVNLSYQSDEHVSGPLTLASEADSRDVRGLALRSLDFVIDASATHDVTIVGTTHRGVGYLDDVQINCLLAAQAACQDLAPFPDRNDLLSAQPYRMNPYATEQSLRLPFFTSGLDGTFDLSRERRWSGRLGLGWQISASHELTAGADLTRFDTRRYTAGMISAFDGDAFAEKPVRTGVYVQDRLSLGRFEVQGSLRLDRFDSRALYPIVPGRISSITDTIAVSGADTFPLAPFDPQNPTANFRRVRAHSGVSPQLRMFFDAWPGATVRVAIGRQVQAPDFRSLFTHKNTDLLQTDRNAFFGRDVGLGHLDLIELGTHVEFSARAASVDVAAYSQDLTGEGARLVRLPDPGANGFPSDFRVFTTTHPGKIRGVDVLLQRRFSDLFAASVTVSHQGGPALDGPRTFAAGTAALTFGDHPPLGKALRNTSLHSIVRVSTNRRYTLLRNAGDGLTIGENVGFDQLEPENSSHLPLFKTFEIRIAKGFGWGRSKWQVFIESKNLLNWTNLTDIFTETGEVTNAQYRARSLAEQVAQLESEAAANGLARTVPGTGEPAVDLSAPGVCVGWASRSSNFAGGPADCVFLQRAERRFGNGDGLYTRSEYVAAFGAWYELVNAPYRFYGPGRRIRTGIQVSF